MKSILSEPELDVSLEKNNLCVDQLCEEIAESLRGNKVKLYEFKGKKKVEVCLEELEMGLTVDINPRHLKSLGY